MEMMKLMKTNILIIQMKDDKIQGINMSKVMDHRDNASLDKINLRPNLVQLLKVSHLG